MEETPYTNPVMPSGQFPFCGNCFRADTYRGCNFGCQYCFANCRAGAFVVKDQVAKLSLIKKWMGDALDRGMDNNIRLELLKHRVPLHLGGMADPFQEREFTYGATREFLKLSKAYKYPVSISTKAARLPGSYYEILDPAIHTFQISLMGLSEDFVRKFEERTPPPYERIGLIKELKKRGFWVSLRLQPLINIEEAEALVIAVGEEVDFITVEHLKIPADNRAQYKYIIGQMGGSNYSLNLFEREWVFDRRVKKENLDRLRSLTGAKFGCADNDLHEFSDSLNCCGIDLMPPAFKNWLKYNSMYIKITGDRTQWAPTRDCTALFNSHTVKPGLTTMKQYVDVYYTKTYGDIKQTRLFKETE